MLIKILVPLADNVKTSDIFGALNGNIAAIEKNLKVDADISSEGIMLTGDKEGVQKAVAVIEKLQELAVKGEKINLQMVTYLSELASGEEGELLDNYTIDQVITTSKGRVIKAKTLGQAIYVKSISKSDVTFSIGPAGTGKTFLAVAMAVNALRKREVSRIVLTRPVVEAGEKLGFLPGDLQDKIDPYMRPLYDALHELMGPESFFRNLEKGNIEISPLAYMRGRTLDDSFIILDEAQNTTPEQMKMFLTRMGFNSKAVVTGDITQTDLPANQKSGLIDAMNLLREVDGVSIVFLNDKDIVRSAIVQRIIRAYEKVLNREV